MGNPRPLPRWLSSDPSEPLDVAALPYLERQAILVVTPEEAEDSRRSLMAAATGDWRPRLSASLDLAGQQAAWRGLQLASLRTIGLIGGAILPFYLLGPSAISAYRAWRRTKVSTLAISTVEAARLRWPHGDPTKYELYIGSPADPYTYYPAASFHEAVLFERYGELRELLSRLGATRITARVARGRGLDGSVAVEGTEPHVAVAAQGSAGFSSRAESAREDTRELLAGPPWPRNTVGDGLHWFSRERDWQRLADLACSGRAAFERLYFRQSSDFGLNANFEAAIKNLPLSVKIGGHYTRYVETVWEVEARFSEREGDTPPISAASDDPRPEHSPGSSADPRSSNASD